MCGRWRGHGTDETAVPRVPRCEGSGGGGGTIAHERRREVAENPRHPATGRHIQYRGQLLDGLAGAAVGLEGFHGLEDLPGKPTDLIDPEGGGDDYR